MPPQDNGSMPSEENPQPTQAPQQPSPPIEPKPSVPTGSSPKTNTMAIFGLVLAFIAPLIGLILSIIAKNQIKKRGEGGAGLATGGIVVSIILMVLQVFAIIFLITTLSVTRLQENKRSDSTSTSSSSNSSTANSSSYSADEKKAVANSEAFLRALSKDDKAAAYLTLSPEFKAELSRSSFDSKIENSNLNIKDWDITSVITNGNGDRVTIKGTLDLSSGSNNGEFELVLYKGADASIGIIQFDLHSS